jgi:hypothetical protein
VVSTSAARSGPPAWRHLTLPWNVGEGGCAATGARSQCHEPRAKQGECQADEEVMGGGAHLDWLTTVSYAARTCGRGRRPRTSVQPHGRVGMSDALGR